jgi:hypothetical protein
MTRQLKTQDADLRVHQQRTGKLDPHITNVSNVIGTAQEISRIAIPLS